MKRVQRLLAVLITALLPALPGAAQQGGVISGRVVDAATNGPIPGVTVVVVGTALGGITSPQGEYRIQGVPAGPRQVRAAVLGYAAATQQVSVVAGGAATADFALNISAIELDEFVVNAVTGQLERRRELGTNVASIDAAEVRNAPVTKVADILTARVPGVHVQTTGGTTGTTQRIRIRGANSLSLSNEPLVFVDGVPFSMQVYDMGVGGAASSRLNDINPADIENIEILKGPAATSQYGTAAANGVVLITTKRGTPGGVIWNAYTEQGVINEATDFPANWVSYEVVRPGAPAFLNDGVANIGFDDQAYDRFTCYNFLAGAGICAQDSTASFNTLEDPRTTPFQQGFRRKWGASVAGGTERTSYFISGDTEGEQGVVSDNELNRASVRANLTARISDDLDVTFTSSYIDSDLSINSNDNSVFSPLINGLIGRALFNPDTTSSNFQQNFRLFTPEQLGELIPVEDINRITIGGQASYRPLSWLTLTSNSGLDFTNRQYAATLQPNRALGAISQGFYLPGFRSTERTNRYGWTGNLSARADYTRGEITASTTVGGSFRRDLYKTLYAEGSGIVEGTRDVGSTTNQFFIDETFSEVRTIGGYVMQQLGYRDRLFLTLGVRGDDNSAFGSDFGFVTYPAVNLSWVVTEEEWFPSIASRYVNNLRLRGGYGASGQQPGFRQATKLYAPARVQVGGADQPGVMLAVTGNSLLEPERTTEWEFGADAGFLDERISADVTWYNRLSKHALISIPLAPSFGLTGSRLDNIGSVRNSGLELGVDARVLDTRWVGLNLRLAATTLNNEIESLGGEEDIVINRGEQRHRVGFPAGAFFQDPYVINDDGDGKLAWDLSSNPPTELTVVPDMKDGERVPHYIGPVLPTYSNAYSGELRILDFVIVSTLFEQRGGNYQLDLTSEFRCRTGIAFQDRGCQAVGDPNASLESQAAFLGSTAMGDDRNTLIGFIHPADFVKWRELSVTVGVPQRFRQLAGRLAGASLTLSGRNLGTWTDYPGLDPEVTEAGVGNFSQNEFNTQPPVRYWTARVNFTF